MTESTGGPRDQALERPDVQTSERSGVQVEPGAVFGRWTVIGDSAPRSYSDGTKMTKRRTVRVRCVCGTEKTLLAQDLRRGRSHGCLSPRCRTEWKAEQKAAAKLEALRAEVRAELVDEVRAEMVENVRAELLDEAVMLAWDHIDDWVKFCTADTSSVRADEIEAFHRWREKRMRRLARAAKERAALPQLGLFGGEPSG